MSRPPKANRAKDYYKQGTRRYAEGKYHDAIASFDRALAFGDKTLHFVLLDSKAAAMSKLDYWRWHAYEITLKLCREYGRDENGKNAFKPWFRKADVLRRLGKHTKALESLNIAGSFEARPSASTQERLSKLRTTILRERSEANQRRLDREADESLREALLETARLKARKAKMSFVHVLPRDVLVNIAEHGIAAKMAMVCKEWRQVVTSQPGLWTTLTIGKGRAVAKAKIWVERSKGRIRILSIEEGFDAVNRGLELVGALGDCLERVETLKIKHRLAKDLLDHMRGRFEDIKRLSVRSTDELSLIPQPSQTLPLDLGLLSPTSHSLRHLDLQTLQLTIPRRVASAGEHSTEIVTLDHALRGLEGVQIVRLAGCRISGGQETIARRFPAAISITFSNLKRSPLDMTVPEGGIVTHHTLQSYTENRPDMPIADIRFAQLRAPSLKTLDLYSCPFAGRYAGIALQILALGLSFARPNLTSLDIGKSAWDPRLLEAFGDLHCLQFLNMSCCGIVDGVLGALKRKGEPTDLLPMLTALSIAGNEDITAGAVRDLVNSRLQPSIRLSQRPPSAPPKKPSAFLPTAPRKSRALGPVPMDAPLLPSQPSSQPELPSISWLNLDSCLRIDPSAATLIRQRVPFVSAICGPIVEDRIRGKGAWGWSAAPSSAITPL